MSSDVHEGRPSARLPLAFWVGLGVPLAIVMIAVWQAHRVGLWLGDPSVHSGHRDVNQHLAQLPPISLLLGGVATVTFCVALAMMRRASARALQSRDALVSAFDAGRRFLPGFMVVQSLLVFGGLVGLLLFEVVHLADSPAHFRGDMKLVFIGAAFALALIWTGGKILWDTVRLALHKAEPVPIEIMGRALSPAQAPLLWKFVGEVAAVARSKLPDSVVVGLNEGFFVTEHPVVLASGGKVPPGRVLYLPLPFMAFLGRGEVAAVVAHELGHFTGEDTGYSLRFTPIYRGLVESILAITNEHDAEDDGGRAWLTAPASLYGKWFLNSFDEAVHFWSRTRELAADAFSSRVAGSAAIALALLRITVLQEIVEEALRQNHEAPPERREGVLAMVRRLVATRGLGDPGQHLEDHQAHPLDSHPTLKQRLDALGVTLTADLVARSREARDSGLLAELGLEAA